MANTFNTLNPLGSTSPKDLSDNASNFDEFVNSTSPSFDDRFGKRRETIAGMEYEFDVAQAQHDAEFQALLARSGLEDLGNYAAGLQVTRRNQVFLRNGVYYRSAAATVLPYTLTGDWAVDGAKFVLTDDGLIRPDLASTTDLLKGAALIPTVARVVPSLAQLRQLPKQGSPLAMVFDSTSVWMLNPGDTSSPENLDVGLLVANDGGRWQAGLGMGVTNAMRGKPGNQFNDNGLIVGWYHPGATSNGNGNKANYVALYVGQDQIVQQIGLNGATGPKVDLFNATLLFGGPFTRGGRHAIDGVCLQIQPTDQNNTDRNYVGVQGQFLTTTGDGGTGPLDVRGQGFGSSSICQIVGTAKFMFNATAHEFNLHIDQGDGNRAYLGNGIQSADYLGERPFGYDFFYSMACLGGSIRGHKYGLGAHALNGAPAFEADSTFIKIFPSASGSQAMDALLDTTGMTFNSLIKADGVNLRSGVLDMNAPGSMISLGSPNVQAPVIIQAKTGGLGAVSDSSIVMSAGTAATGKGVMQLNSDLLVTAAGAVRSTTANYTSLGTTQFPFSQLVVQTSPVISSDLGKKKDVAPLRLGLDFVKDLRAQENGIIEFKYLDGGVGSSEHVQVGTRKVQRQVLEDYEETLTSVEIIEGKPVQRSTTVARQRPVCDLMTVHDENDEIVMVEEKKPVGTEDYFDEELEVWKKRVAYERRMVPMTVQVPRMEWVEEPIFEEQFTNSEGVRTHLGFGAQVVGKLLKDYGLEDCAAWCLSDKDDSESAQMLRLEQLIPVLFNAVAELSEQVQALRQL